MSESTIEATQSPPLETIQADWSEYDRLARWLAWSKLHWREGVDVDESVAEAIAHAWCEFVRIRTRRPNKAVKTAIRHAVKFGVGRVVRRIRLLPKPHPNYIDALDRRSPNALREDELAPRAELYQAVRDTTDRTTVEAIIEKLPAHVQAFARLLSYGRDKASIRAQRGLSRRQSDRLVGDLRESLAKILCASSRG